MKHMRKILSLLLAVTVIFSLTGCVQNLKLGSNAVKNIDKKEPAAVSAASGTAAVESVLSPAESEVLSESSAEPAAVSQPAAEEVTSEVIAFDPSWEYAANSKINSGTATLYHAKPTGSRGIVVCVNAGHGTKGGSDVKTLCHPDGSPKVTGGTTESGATEAMAVSSGMTFLDGTPEAAVTLKLALVLKDKLLDAGFDVLMIRETDDVQLDNIARTVMANNMADCHIALHYDSTDFDKGVFFFSVPSADVYRSMEPVASHWQEHNALGEALVSSLELAGFKLFEGGAMEMDLTQTSYSTVPSVDIEVGDAASKYTDDILNSTADGLVLGVDSFFKANPKS